MYNSTCSITQEVNSIHAKSAITNILITRSTKHAIMV